jgi:hypothetical protein
MLEKLFLAIIITFSLNFFFQVRVLNLTHSHIYEQQYHTETLTTILVKTPKK